MLNSHLSRRDVLGGSAKAALLATAASLPFLRAEALAQGKSAPVPLDRVDLLPSPFLRAVEANLDYLLRLEPDRLLHNFRLYAGLEPKAPIYGGWEDDTIAGHTLGHYLTALSLMHAQTGNEECRERARYIVGELQACQEAGGDGYVAGFTRKAEDGEIESGRRVFEEIAEGDIRPAKFYINGSWAPLYNWHKLFAGLHHADRLLGDERAVAVAEGLAGYLEGIFSQITDAQMQEVLSCEHGGINESLADLHARTGDPRWLRLSERLYHRAVLDPLAHRRDELSHLHANTQIPKLIGLARLHQITGKQRYDTASSFFWDTVTAHRTYVIGGNADREYFQESNSISHYITEETCESCNTYNMLKLTRELYKKRPSAAYFDYYERGHFNHILAQHRPEDGMFAYMVPLMAGAHRSFSEPFDSFWCCVGTGMESHAKHGDSIYWASQDRLHVNLYIPSVAQWPERAAKISTRTGYPYEGEVKIRLDELPETERFDIALRIPAWAEDAAVSVNGQRERLSRNAAGYAVLTRQWRAGDEIVLDLPMRLRLEATPDDPKTVAVLYGPLVLAADLGPDSSEYALPAPAFVTDDPLSGFSPIEGRPGRFRTAGVAEPFDLEFAPFYEMHDRSTAVYFSAYSPAEWEDARAAFDAERAALAALDARSVDLVVLGDPESEEAHGLESDISYAVEYRKRPGRDARTGGFFAFDMEVGEGPHILQATYWGGERERAFAILVDGEEIARQTLQGEKSGEWIERRYRIPAELTRGKDKVRIRFEPETGHTAGPAFGCRLLPA
ncbi:glycoside hydrolase family 127 protein [Parvularcula oceani]|uniref:glycoside hydrolase family 127 protein n=1 Tax=Parvularcula oceani TaxID=1247963 RepID=UPI0004E0D102|nr:glycoside hydrolase family 127 protein [Parvularcula oceani]